MRDSELAERQLEERRRRDAHDMFRTEERLGYDMMARQAIEAERLLRDACPVSGQLGPPGEIKALMREAESLPEESGQLPFSVEQERAHMSSIVQTWEIRERDMRPDPPAPKHAENMEPPVGDDIESLLSEMRAVLAMQQKFLEALSREARKIDRAAERFGESVDKVDKATDRIGDDIMDAIDKVVLRKAEPLAVKRINDVAERVAHQLNAAERDAEERVKRLSKILLPDKLFNVAKWTTTTLVLFIAAWFIVTTIF